MTKTTQMSVEKCLWLVFLTVVLLFFIQGSIGSACAEEFYVSPRGNDAQPGTEGQPWRTLQHAVNAAQPGDTIFLKAGRYLEEVHLTRSGSMKNPLTIAAAPGEAVTVLSLLVEPGVSHLKLKDFTVRGYQNWGIELSGDNHYITLSGLKIQGGEVGLRLTVGHSGGVPEAGPVSDITLEDCVIQNTVYAGVDGTPGPCNHLTFRQVEVSGAGLHREESYAADGISIEKGHHITVENCFCMTTAGTALTSIPGTDKDRCRVLWSGATGWCAII